MDPTAVILIGVDFSETAAQAARRASELALRMDVGTRCVHVREGLRRDAWAPSAAEASWLEALGFHPGDLIVRTGTPWMELVRVAEQEAADLVVVGTHGRTGFQPVQLGSTAGRLALLSPRPVLLVGGRPHPGAAGAALAAAESRSI